MEGRKASDFPPQVLHCTSNHDRVNAGWPRYEAAAKLAWSRSVAFLKQHLRG